MNLNALRTIIRANWPSDYHSDDLVNAKLNQFINDTQRWVCRGSIILPNVFLNHNFSFLETEAYADTVDEQRRYDLPSASETILAFKADKNVELVDYLGYRHLLIKVFKKHIEDKRKFANTEGKGTPTYFCIEQGDIWLYSLPDHSVNNDEAFTINMEYYGYLADLSEDSDNNVLTDSYPEILEWGATAAGFRFGFDIEQAEYFGNKAKERLIGMIQEDEDKALSGIEEGVEPTEGQSLASNT